MNMNREKQKQIIFLVLIIGCSIVTFNNWYNKRKNNERTAAAIIEQTINLSQSSLLNHFRKNPNSEEGLNSLFKAIASWEKQGQSDSIQLALSEFEKRVRNNKIRNKFYLKLGQL